MNAVELPVSDVVPAPYKILFAAKVLNVSAPAFDVTAPDVEPMVRADRVPTLVKDEVTTEEFSVVPVSVPAGAAERVASIPSDKNVEICEDVRAIAEVEPPETFPKILWSAIVASFDNAKPETSNVIAGVVVAFATVPDKPFAVTTERVVTVPLPPPEMVCHDIVVPLL